MAKIVKVIRYDTTIEIRDLPPWIIDWYKRNKSKEEKGESIDDEESFSRLTATIRHRFTNYDQIVDEISQDREIHEIAERIKKDANRKIWEKLKELVPDRS